MSRNEEFLTGSTFSAEEAGPGHADWHMLKMWAPGQSPEQPSSASLWWNKETGTIGALGVAPEYRRRGVATEMLRRSRQFSQEKGLVEPQHSPERTDQGEAWAQSLGEELPPQKRIRG